ncbi:MAG: 2Fe-2S iron-sulfur cluster binding domain-containing protein [Proteobacteria bacterium]|nr:2Fe-2S iron-sulfur cluster binding domain-containing protein [Pseudomonadota bacterium]
MSETITLTINGREISAPVGTTILEAAGDANIGIPHLCHNEELAPYGSCRLCLVEITQGKRTRLVASCIYEVAEGLRVRTHTERVLNVRRLVVELLLTRNPDHPVLLEMAESLQVEKSRFEADPKGCILCGMCVRTCREVVEVSALGFKGRGHARTVATPFDDAPPDCIACGSCAYVCPVQVIPMEEKNGVRTIWNTQFPMQKCATCGRDIAPRKQLDYFRRSVHLPDGHFDNCLHCR